MSSPIHSPLSSPRSNQYAHQGLNSLPTYLKPLSPNEVSRIVGIEVKEGEKIKGESRITYLPYEKKVTEYEERQYIERVPKVRKVVQYEEKKIVEEVPREVVATDYYAVESIKQYYKEVIPEKQIEFVPIEKKVRKIEYVPVQKQIVHYPEGQDYEAAKNQSRVVLQSQGVAVRPDAEFKLLDPRLLYQYSAVHSDNPVGYVEDGHQRNLSTAPTVQTVGYYTGPQHQHSQHNYQQNYQQTYRPNYQSNYQSNYQPNSQPNYQPIESETFINYSSVPSQRITSTHQEINVYPR